MKVILSKKQALFLDSQSQKKGYISNDELMDNAGRLSAEYLIETIEDPFNKRFLVIAGNGNNGGDALIMHYYLIKYGIDSSIYFVNKKSSKSLLVKYQVSDKYQISHIDSELIKEFDWFIDGIFGVGLNRPINGKIKKILELLDGHPIISLDIPSGLNSDSGNTFKGGLLCKPKHVLSMGYLKPANIMGLGKQFFSNTEILDIKFPEAKKLISDIEIFLIEKDDIISMIKEESILRNKYDFFCNLIVGSQLYAGAGVLSMSAALKGGASYAQIFVPDKISSIYKKSSSESKIIGIGNKDFFHLKDFNKVINILLDRKAPVLIGPGLGIEKNTQSFTAAILKFLKKDKRECVLDASGFEPLYSEDITIDDLPSKCILTPHRGEFDKIFTNYSKTNKSELEICREVSEKLNGRVLILKGPTTIVVSSDKKLYVINNANSLLASAGSGDVLSGILIGLLSRGYTLNEAALIGVYIHSLCSDIFYLKKSRYRMLSQDILDIIPKAFDEIL